MIIYHQSNQRLEEAVAVRDTQIESLQKRIGIMTLNSKELGEQLTQKEKEIEQLRNQEEADEKYFKESNDETYNKWGNVTLPPIVIDFMLNKKLYR